MSNGTFPALRCTIADQHGGFCDQPVPDGAPISACAIHLRAAYTYCQDLIDRASSNLLAGLKIDAVPLTAGESIRDRIRAQREVVYYMRVGQQIKIGRTVHLATRLKQLRADELLATEPGGSQMELARLKQFAHLKVDDGRREYFHPGPDLLEHVARLQRADA